LLQCRASIWKQNAIRANVLQSISIAFQHVSHHITKLLHVLYSCYFLAVAGFQNAIWAYVLHSISITFQRVPKRVLGDWRGRHCSSCWQKW
jgi:hypothetical protein